MNQITTCLLTKNNADTIQSAIRSVRSLGPVLVGDCGSTDSTLVSARMEGANITALPFQDRSQAKNHLSALAKTSWLLVLEPWENLAGGKDEIIKIANGPEIACRVQVLQGSMLIKETRLWATRLNFQFRNPVYETIDPVEPMLETYIVSKGDRDFKSKYAAIEQWEAARATFPDPHYYHACLLLSEGKYDEFLSRAERYLFLENKGISAVMTNYYVGLILLYFKKKPQEALEKVLPCLAVKPTMAEFWCLLGDVYYRTRDYARAKTFYENAIILGARRLKTDFWPMDIVKYKEYPEKMIASCESLRHSILLLGG
jgi:tetratricopeptide (TPR) repeat protein